MDSLCRHQKVYKMAGAELENLFSGVIQSFSHSIMQKVYVDTNIHLQKFVAKKQRPFCIYAP